MNRFKFVALVVVSIVIAVLLATALTSFTRVSDSALAEGATPRANVGAGLSRPSIAGANYLPIIFLNSTTAGGAWLLAGNGGTNWLTDFLGTTDDMTLTLRVSNTIAYRLVPAVHPGLGFAPDLIGGAPENNIAPGLYGATIGGGGVSGSANVISGTGNYATIGGGSTNTASGTWTTVGGGGANTASGIVSTIAGGFVSTASGDRSTIGGGDHNTASGTIATISGGGSNSASGSYAAIGGGYINTASGWYTTIGGGTTNAASGYVATVGGGYANTANQQYATVAGGAHNHATGAASYVGGGNANNAGGDSATVGGGGFNLATGVTSTVGGGWFNTASGLLATIGGGDHNTASNSNATVGGGWFNTASGFLATIGGGVNNTASGVDATVGGGQNNTASGVAATVPGGNANTAAGDYSFAAGCQAKANHNGSFVWADGTCTDFVSGAANQFLAHANGGFQFYSGFGVGAALAPGSGSWSSFSNKDLKANFAAVDSRAVLAQVNALPITTWNYRTQDESIRHIGPMAQDFAAAFKVGENDTTISTVDAQGVALAAIQGLNQVVAEKETRLAALEKDNAELKMRLAALEQNTPSNALTLNALVPWGVVGLVAVWAMRRKTT